MTHISGRKLAAVPRQPPVTAAELGEALEQLLAAKKQACDVLDRAMSEAARVPGRSDLTAAIGAERARLACSLMDHMRIQYDPDADAA